MHVGLYRYNRLLGFEGSTSGKKSLIIIKFVWYFTPGSGQVYEVKSTYFIGTRTGIITSLAQETKKI